MKIVKSLKLLRPVLYFIFLAIAALILSCVLLSTWHSIVRKIEHSVHSSTQHEDLPILVIQRQLRVALALLIVTVCILIITISSFIPINIKTTKREMNLRALLIKQMEATQQAERKSMNKSHAIASASHDIRANLAGITGLIEICYHQAAPHSELRSNLRKMASNTEDLLHLLNSILDTSKIEAGKMQLEEEEFNVVQLLEDAVDLYHPAGMKKGVDIVLDTCDSTIIKFSQVKGDRGRLKQVLCNLLSNAVKFTSEGHISVRAWAKKRRSGECIDASDQCDAGNCCECFFHRTKDEKSDPNTVNANKQNYMEVVFEVDDTGKGIPKEQRKSVFENYVQVKETAQEGGTGLGLGIVQSIVRLMGGEIGIVDKDIGEKGTCFRFNVFLTVCDGGNTDNAREDDIEIGGGDNTHQNLGLTILTSSRGLSTCSSSSRFSPRLEKSQVVLLIQPGERQRVIKRFMDKLGSKVTIINKWEELPPILKWIKRKFNRSSQSLTEWFELSSRSDSASLSARDLTTTKDVLLTVAGSADNSRRTNVKGASNFALIVIDSTSISFPEVQSCLTEFKRRLNGTCRVVWLQSPITYDNKFSALEDYPPDQDDIIISKPLHGTRLFDLIRTLPEFGGSLQGSMRNQEERTSADPRPPVTQPGADEIPSLSRHHSQQAREHDIKEEDVTTPISSDKPLHGKKVLIVDDSSALQMVATVQLKNLGATVEKCKNGAEALNLVTEGLNNRREEGPSSLLPFDYIFMDCEMPVMNGYEATKMIRKLEENYNVHMPIIAVTAHSSGEAEKTMEAGMDAHLVKPINKRAILDSISKLNI